MLYRGYICCYMQEVPLMAAQQTLLWQSYSFMNATSAHDHIMADSVSVVLMVSRGS